MKLNKILESDIQLCTELLNTSNHEESKEFIECYVAKYNDIISNIYKGLNYYGMIPHDDKESVFKDIKKIKGKLEVVLAMGVKKENNNANISILNKNSNIVNVDISFESVRKEIESIGTLNVDKIDEILKKIDEIQDISLSKDSKNRKWGNLKEHFNWLSTNGVDIAIKILPLILKTINNDN